jgi:hypothetical protein
LYEFYLNYIYIYIEREREHVPFFFDKRVNSITEEKSSCSTSTIGRVKEGHYAI